MKQKIPDRTQWHSCFAWFPVNTIDVVSVWFERIERRCYFSHMYGDEYEYRLPLSTGPSA